MRRLGGILHAPKVVLPIGSDHEADLLLGIDARREELAVSARLLPRGPSPIACVHREDSLPTSA